METHERSFEENRRLLFSVAYRMLGTVADAEDAVQEAWLRWQRVDLESVATAQAYLVTTITRLCIDQLKSARMRREVYIGPWLPEPIVQTGAAPDAQVALAETLSIAMLLMLERLNPVERAAFLLREIFGYSYPNLAQVLDKSEDNCRQLVKRAKARIQAGESRYAPTQPEQDELVAAFFSAIEAGNVDALAGRLRQDAILYSDGGGKAKAALRPIFGASRIAKFLIGVSRKFRNESHHNVLARVNGALGVVVYRGKDPEGIVTADIADGKIAAVYVVRNPDKLTHVPWGPENS